MIPKEYLIKRKPQKPPIKENEIYVSRKTNFNALLKRTILLFDRKDINMLYIKSMGPAITKAISLVLNLKNLKSELFTFEIFTGTSKVVDDIIPADMEKDFDQQTRLKSTIEIKITKNFFKHKEIDKLKLETIISEKLILEKSSMKSGNKRNFSNLFIGRDCYVKKDKAKRTRFGK
ncbi:hypothetical protein HK099_008069 [Clydaea vesicula]|uniref:Uncharacterized protein n=1 Tax=Clydaea vesicula TaxID=447962 RepID=A0AAD5U978_9FUNG|nr:hypothetical protein HK099_008069 [Clydaea vesicula]